jgi:hypothetical protein
MPRRLFAAVRALVRREPMAAWLGLAAITAILVRAHLAFMTPGMPLNPDEGYIMAFGQRMLEGHLLPYVDAVSHRGPLLYWVGALIAGCGEFSWRPIRVAGMLVATVPGLLAFLAARRAGFPLAGVFASIATAFTTLIMFDPVDGIAFNGEPLMNVFMTASFLGLVYGLGSEARWPSWRWVMVSGACAMMGVLCKQVGAVMLAPFSLWVLAAALGQPELPRRERWRLALVFPAGVLLPALAVLLRYALAGQLPALRYWLFTYNLDIYMFPYRAVPRWEAFRAWFDNNILSLTLAAGAMAWSFGRLVLALRRARSLFTAYHQVGFIMTVALSAAAGLLGAKLAMRDFGHYFLQATPWLGLLLGLIAEPAVTAGEPPRPLKLFFYQALVLLPFIVIIGATWYPRQRQKEAWARGYQRGELCQIVSAHSRPGDHLFVWGFWPSIYVDCQRRPASRYVFTTFPAGFVPWFDRYSKQDDDRLMVPHGRELLLADLETARPPVIVDAPNSLGFRSMRRYPVLGDYLDQHYHWVASLDAVDLYVRGKSNRRVLFDFEEERLDGWVLEGDAFAAPTATGNGNGQSIVNGWQGRRFVNSFTPGEGDAATGRATSPSFTIDRNRLGLLMGGGKSARVSLEVDGAIVGTHSGRNLENLAEFVVDVSAHRGKTARLILEDPASGPWDHLLVDRVELFDVE